VAAARTASEETGAAKASAPPEAPGETARAAGRGGLAIAGAKVSFILFGFAQQVILPRLLGVDGYGQASLVLSIVSIVNNVIVATSIQGVSRAVSSAPAGQEGPAFRATLRVHVVLAMIASLSFAALAGTIADRLGAPHVTGPLRLVAAVVLLYGVYAPLVGSLNGRRRFLEQAALDVSYGALRTVGIASGAWLFLRSGQSGVLGAFAGFVAAAALIVPAALGRSGIGERGDSGPTLREYGAFLLPVAVSQGFLNLLMQTDSLSLRYFLGRAASTTQAADALQGVYRGAQLFSFLPYQMLMSITFILFPMLARAQADGDREAVAAYTRTGVRYALVLTALMTGVVAGIAPHLLRLAFPKEMWTQGGEVLRVHCLGMGAFAILGVICAALTSLGQAQTSARLTLAAVVLVALGCFVLVPRAPFGAAMLVSSATATTLALALTAVAGAALLRRSAGAFAAPLTLVRTLATLGISLAVGSRLPWLGLVGTVGEAAALGVLGAVVLVASGELDRQDLARVLAVVGKKK
jgi:stage V sporulation protein B